jgi:hypothetical protein
MPQATPRMDTIVTVKPHDKLRSVKQSEFATKAADVLRDADRGQQTTVQTADGVITATIGLNGHRFFPDPTPDPLDDILELALHTEKVETK